MAWKGFSSAGLWGPSRGMDVPDLKGSRTYRVNLLNPDRQGLKRPQNRWSGRHLRFKTELDINHGPTYGYAKTLGP